MKKITNFFQLELNSCNENKARIESDIHRANIDIEFLNKTKLKLISETDNTHDVFFASGNDSTFSSREIVLLNQKEDDLNKRIMTESTSLEQVQNRIDTIKEMLEECSVVSVNDNLSVSGISILEIQEAERQRIARDIHDSVVQKMTAIIYKSEFAMKVIDSDLLRAKLELEVINKVVRECINELRGIILNLRPMSLDDLGLEVTLKRNIAELKNSTDMNIDFKYIEQNITDIKPIVSATVLRIIQELCSNAIKYSEGSQINIEISAQDNKLIILFEDDGIGFDRLNTTVIKNNTTGFGIPFLKERVKLLNGCVKIDKGTMNKGTRYYIQIPFHNEEK